MERRNPRSVAARPLVLIVEGHEDTRALYAIGLSSMGFEVVAESNCANAYGRAWKLHPDIIVTLPDALAVELRQVLAEQSS
jgi:DNA-binding response OmpR family regulator